jgi:hypothetical protein
VVSILCFVSCVMALCQLQSFFDKGIIMNGEQIKQDCVMRNSVLVFERFPVRTSA